MNKTIGRKRLRLLWQLYPTYLFVSILTLVIGGWLIRHWLSDKYHEENRSRLEQHTTFVQQEIEAAYPQTFTDSKLITDDSHPLYKFLYNLGNSTDLRITLFKGYIALVV